MDDDSSASSYPDPLDAADEESESQGAVPVVGYTADPAQNEAWDDDFNFDDGDDDERGSTAAGASSWDERSMSERSSRTGEDDTEGGDDSDDDDTEGFADGFSDTDFDKDSDDDGADADGGFGEDDDVDMKEAAAEKGSSSPSTKEMEETDQDEANRTKLNSLVAKHQDSDSEGDWGSHFMSHKSDDGDGEGSRHSRSASDVSTIDGFSDSDEDDEDAKKADGGGDAKEDADTDVVGASASGEPAPFVPPKLIVGLSSMPSDPSPPSTSSQAALAKAKAASDFSPKRDSSSLLHAGGPQMKYSSATVPASALNKLKKDGASAAAFRTTKKPKRKRKKHIPLLSRFTEFQSMLSGGGRRSKKKEDRFAGMAGAHRLLKVIQDPTGGAMRFEIQKYPKPTQFKFLTGNDGRTMKPFTEKQLEFFLAKLLKPFAHLYEQNVNPLRQMEPVLKAPAQYSSDERWLLESVKDIHAVATRLENKKHAMELLKDCLGYLRGGDIKGFADQRDPSPSRAPTPSSRRTSRSHSPRSETRRTESAPSSPHGNDRSGSPFLPDTAPAKRESFIVPSQIHSSGPHLSPDKRKSSFAVRRQQKILHRHSRRTQSSTDAHAAGAVAVANPAAELEQLRTAFGGGDQRPRSRSRSKTDKERSATPTGGEPSSQSSFSESQSSTSHSSRSHKPSHHQPQAVPSYPRGSSPASSHHHVVPPLARHSRQSSLNIPQTLLKDIEEHAQAVPSPPRPPTRVSVPSSNRKEGERRERDRDHHERDGDFRVPRSPRRAHRRSNASNDRQFTHLYLLAYLCAKLEPGGRTFRKFYKEIKKLYPHKTTLMDLLDTEQRAHHSGADANLSIRRFVHIFTDARRDGDDELAAAAIASLHLYYSNYSPLNVSVLTGDACYNLNDEEFEWYDQARDPLHSPPMPDEGGYERMCWKLSDSDFRNQMLEEYYQKISPHSVLRARLAFAIGLHYLNKHTDAESIFFECIHILKETKAAFPGYAPLVSELGTNALIIYGDLLLNNKKYKYSILALEAAIVCQKFRRKTADAYEMERRLCEVCTEHDDWDRSLKYHLRILQRAKQRCDINEFVYISQQICKIFTQHGNFFSAEHYLFGALSFVRNLASGGGQSRIFPSDRSSSTPNGGIPQRVGQDEHFITSGEFRQARLNLYLKLAELYTDGNRFSDAIKILRQILRSNLPRGKKVIDVQMLLAEAFMKRRMFHDAISVLEKIESSPPDEHGTEHWGGGGDGGANAAAWGRRPGGGSGTASASMLGSAASNGNLFGGSGNTTPTSRDRRSSVNASTRGSEDSFRSVSDFVCSPDFLDIRANAFMGVGRLEEALEVCDQALKHCTKNAISIQARFYNLKGRILQAIAFDELRQVKERVVLGQPMDGLPRVDEMLPPGNPPFGNALSEEGTAASSTNSSMRRTGRTRLRSNTATAQNQDMRAGAKPVVDSAKAGASGDGGSGDSGSVTPRGSRSKSTHSAPNTAMRSRSLKRSLSRRRKRGNGDAQENGIKRGSMFGNKRESTLQAPILPMSPERKEKRVVANGNGGSPAKMKKRSSQSTATSPLNRSKKRPSMLMLEDSVPGAGLGAVRRISLSVDDGSGGGDGSGSGGPHASRSPVEVLALHMPNVRKCVSAFTTAYDLYKKIDDRVRSVKALLSLCETYLHILMTVVGVPDNENTSGDSSYSVRARLSHCREWLKNHEFNVTDEVPKTDPSATGQNGSGASAPASPTSALPEINPATSLARIERPALKSIDQLSVSLNPDHLLENYIALAELFYLQDRRDLSKMYWTEARETMFALYVEGPESVLCAHGSPEFQVRSEQLFRRLVRLLFCYDCEFIEKSLFVVETFQTFQRCLRDNLHIRFAASADTYGDYGESVESSMTLLHEGGVVGSGAGGGSGAAGGSGHYGNRLMPGSPTHKHQLAPSDDGTFSSPSLRQVRQGKRVRSWKNKTAHTVGAMELSSALARGEYSSRSFGGRASVDALSIVTRAPLEQRFRKPYINKSGTVDELAEVLIEKADAYLWKIRRNCSRYSARALSQADVNEGNKKLVTKLLACMNQLRNLTRPRERVRRKPTADKDSKPDLPRPSTSPLGGTNSAKLTIDYASNNEVTSHPNFRHQFATSPLRTNEVMCIYLHDIFVIYQPSARMKFVAANSDTSHPYTSPPPVLLEAAQKHCCFTHLSPLTPGLVMEPDGNDSPTGTLHPNAHAPAHSLASFQSAMSMKYSTAHSALKPGDRSTTRYIHNPKDGRSGGGRSGAATSRGTAHPPSSSLSNSTSKSVSSAIDILSPKPSASSSARNGAHHRLSNVFPSETDSHTPPPPSASSSSHTNKHPPLSSHSSSHSRHKKQPHSSRSPTPSQNSSSSSTPSHPLVPSAADPQSSASASADAASSNGQARRSISQHTRGVRSARHRADLTADEKRLIDAELYPMPLDMLSVRELMGALDPKNVVSLMAAVLGECKIVFVSDERSRLLGSVNALIHLLYPFSWQHLFVPYVDAANVNFLWAPAPYIACMDSALLEHIRPPLDAIVVRLDCNYVDRRGSHFTPLPPLIAGRLYKVFMTFMSAMFVLVRREPDTKAKGNKLQRNRSTSQLTRVLTSPIGVGENAGSRNRANSPSQSIDQSTARNLQFIIPKRALFPLQYERVNPLTGGSGRNSMKTDMRLSDTFKWRKGAPVLEPYTPRARRYAAYHAPHEQTGLQHLKDLRAGILDALASVFFKYRLFLSPPTVPAFSVQPFLEHSRQDFVPFLKSFCVTLSFTVFIALRCALPNNEVNRSVFDEQALTNAARQYKQIVSVGKRGLEGWFLFSRGGSRWKRRYAVLERDKILIYKNRQCEKEKDVVELGQDCKVSYNERDVTSPNAEDAYSFEIVQHVPVAEGDAKLSKKATSKRARNSRVDFRAESLDQREMWVRAVRARVLPDHLRTMYQLISDLIPVLHASNAHNYPATKGGGGGGKGGHGHGGASERTPARKHGGRHAAGASPAMARARLAADLSSSNGAQWDWS